MPPRHGGSGGISSSRPSIGGNKARSGDTAWVGVFFRPERYPRRELGPIGVLAQVHSDDSTARRELRALFQNRFEFEWPLARAVGSAG
jgi:hypothetical protein